METGEDFAIIFKEEKFLQDYQDRQMLKKALQTTGRTDLVTKWEVYVAARKWEC